MSQPIVGGNGGGPALPGVLGEGEVESAVCEAVGWDRDVEWGLLGGEVGFHAAFCARPQLQVDAVFTRDGPGAVRISAELESAIELKKTAGGEAPVERLEKNGPGGERLTVPGGATTDRDEVWAGFAAARKRSCEEGGDQHGEATGADGIRSPVPAAARKLVFPRTVGSGPATAPGDLVGPLAAGIVLKNESHW